MHIPGPLHSLTRRDAVKTLTALAGAALVMPAFSRPRAENELRVGVIGCGGRGTGAAGNALAAAREVRIHALADVLPERVEHAANQLSSFGSRADVPAARRFSGFDCWRSLLDSGVDVVILATPPHFRPMHFEAAIRAGKHVFMEKPGAVDPAGVRRLLEASTEADRKRLCVVTGTQRRHEKSYLQAMERVHAGALGRIIGARCSWNQGGLWMHPRQPAWSDMEWQLRNWLYFTWLSGDHIVEQHVHNLDVVLWALRSLPTRCWAMGGRQVRTDPAYGHVFDHFYVEYEFPGGVVVSSACRQIDGCSGKVEETIEGADASITLAPGRARLTPREGSDAKPWSFSEANNDPYTQEHVDLYDAIRAGRHVNEAPALAHSTLTAIMGRMAAYSGKVITWEQALSSPLDLSPPGYEFGPLPVPEVAMPGRTPAGV